MMTVIITYTMKEIVNTMGAMIILLALGSVIATIAAVSFKYVLDYPGNIFKRAALVVAALFLLGAGITWIGGML